MKVFITRQIPEVGIRQLEDAGIEISIWTHTRELSPEELIAHCKDCDGLISAGYNKINDSFLKASKHLKVIALHSVGFDNVDVVEATRLKIPVGNTPGVVSDATADTAFLLMLAVSRKAFFLHTKIINGGWEFFEPTANLGLDLRGKTLGIYGLGKIGFEMAMLCKGAFHMKVIYHNRSSNPRAEKELNAKLVSFDEQMKRSAIFINTARGGIHNEHDLIAALQNELIWGAGLDVTNPEPMKKDNPLLTMPSVAITPHIGTATVETRNAMAKMATLNIIAGLKGERIPFPVNPEVYD